MTTRIIPAALAILLAASAAFAIPGDLEQEARDAMDRGAAWLAARLDPVKAINQE